ncbi:MAG: outer membrane lipoprotein carrier protein LolA [Bacteroidetes bacterium]|nr:outer membrane lipoprotein carrier protein LolA [Bacteroidota bacterium]
MKRILYTTLSILMGMQLTAQDANTGDRKSNEILERLTARTESYKTIEVEFVYKMENTDAGIDEQTEGKLMVMGDKYRLNIAGQTVISDGATLWTYIEDAEEVQINSLEDAEESISPNKLLSSYSEDYRSKYIGEEFLYGTTAYVIDLTPIEGKSYYKVRLIIDKEKDQLLDATIFDKNGSTYSYVIRKFTPNVDVPESTFTFDKSEFPDADVIDMR